MKKITLSIAIAYILLLPWVNTYGQSDSLRKVGWQYFKQLEYPLALELSKSAYHLAYEAKLDSLAGQVALNLGIIYEKLGHYDSAAIFNAKAAKLYKKLRHSEKLFHAYRNLALNHGDLGNLSQALAETYKAANLAKKLTSSPILYYHAIELVGRILEELEEWEAAKREYQRGLNWAKKNDLKDAHASLLNSLGNVQFGMQDWDSAIYYYQSSMQEVKNLGNQRLESYLYNNLGQVLIEIGQMDSSLFYLQKSLTLKEEYFPEIVFSTINLLAKAYIELGQHGVAYDYLQQSYAAGQQSRDVEILRECEGLWVSYYQGIGDYQSALKHMQSLDSIRENVFRNQTLKVTKQQAARQVKQREAQIMEQELKLESERRTKTIIMFMVGVLLLLLLVLFHFFRKTRKLSARNELLLKEQNHRVKNNLQMINSLLSLQSQELSIGAAKSALNESQLRINSVALLHRMLYEGEQIGTIKMDQYLLSLGDEVRYAAGRKMQVILEVPSELLLSIEKATSLGLIINELLTNSIKHVPEQISLKVDISFVMQFSQLEMTYMDNGQGVSPEDWNQSSSFGHQLIRIQVDQLRGRFEVTQQEGFRFKLRLKG